MEREVLYDCLSRIGKLVESPEKLKIIDAICQAERSGGINFRGNRDSLQSVSHHLQKLTDYGFLRRSKRGRRGVLLRIIPGCHRVS